MTKLLVSVRSASEAQIALGAGVDLIDVKEPRAGALGAASPAVWTQIASQVAGARPLSAALGELTDTSSCDTAARNAALAGYTFAKLGLAGCAALADWQSRWQATLAALPSAVTPVAVAYADYAASRAPHPEEVCTIGARLGCGAFLIDTFEKTRGDVFELLKPALLRELLQAARDRGMTTVLAGSLRLARLDEALALQPDYVAIRGAVCRQERSGDLDVGLIGQWVQRLASV